MRGRRPITRDSTYWTKARVIAGLKLFFKYNQFTPTSFHHYHSLTRYTGMTHERDFPSAYGIFRWFETMRQAWEAAGITVDRSHEPYTELEDWYLYEAAGILSRAQIAADLRRTEGSVKRRWYDLGIDARTRWGWAIHRIAEHTQIPAHLFDGYMYRGDLPYFRGNRFIYIDPGDLPDIDIIDWRRVTKDLKNAVRQSLMQRAVLILEGKDWRLYRPQQPHPQKKTDRVYHWKKYEPAPPMPFKLKRGDIVEVTDVDPVRKVRKGRRGVVHLVLRTRGDKRRQAGWYARVEFKKDKARRSTEKRVIYGLPMTTLKKVRRRHGDPIIPETALRHSAARQWYKITAGQRRKGAKLRRNSVMREQELGRARRMDRERERMRRRDERRTRAVRIVKTTGQPFRGRSASRR